LREFFSTWAAFATLVLSTPAVIWVSRQVNRACEREYKVSELKEAQGVASELFSAAQTAAATDKAALEQAQQAADKALAWEKEGEFLHRPCKTLLPPFVATSSQRRAYSCSVLNSSSSS
jgi:hypothetical protein